MTTRNEKTSKRVARNEKTSAEVARIASAILESTAILWIAVCPDESPQLICIKPEAFRTLAASALTQTADKPKRAQPVTKRGKKRP